MAKKPPVTSANSRQERIKNRGKAPKSTPKGRQTTAMQRPFKPGTKTSNTTGQRALPPGKKGGPLTKVTKALPPGKKGGPIVGTKGGALANQAKPSGNFRAPSLPKGTVKVAGKTLSTLGKVGRGLGVAGATLGAADTINSIVNPRSEGNQQLAKAMAAVNKRFSSNYGPRFKKSGSQPAAKPAAKSQMGPMPALKGGFVNGKLQMTQVAKPKKPAAKPAAPKASSAPARSSAPSRSSAPARTPTSRPAAKPAAKPKAPASMATESSMSASDIMKGYGMRVNQTFLAESPSTSKKRQSLKDQTAEIKKMIEESKKRQGKG